MIPLKETRIFIRLVLVHCLFPLLAGGAVYLLFHPARFGGILPFRFPAGHPVLQLLFNSLPDFCWSYSLAMALFLFALHFQFRRSHISLLVALLLPGAELIQLLFPEKFTFDWNDLAAAILAVILSMLSYGIIRKTYGKEAV